MKALRAVILLLALSCAGILASLYLLTAPGRRAPEPLVAVAGSDAAPHPAAEAQFTPADPPRPAPALAFSGRDGAPHRLSDFRGHWLLVNLWATWCAPCVHEMPSLDRMQAHFGDRLTVLAISEDRRGGEVVEPFLRKLPLHRLAVFLDPGNAAGQALEVTGLPTSFLIDTQGRIVGSLLGAAEWDSPAMVARLEGYLSAPDKGVIKTSGSR